MIGRPLVINGQPVAVLGVVPSSFESQNLGWGARPDVWITLAGANALIPALRRVDVLGQRNIPFVLMMGRLDAGATLESARFEMAVLASRLTGQAAEREADVALEISPLGAPSSGPPTGPSSASRCWDSPPRVG